jgi:hypothetical protein
MSQQEQTIGTNAKNQKLWAVSDFKIISETWDKHKIKDGSLLKARVILSSVMLETSLNEIEARVRAGEKPKIGLAFRTRNFFEIESPPELRGEPDTKQYSNEELRASTIETDMDFNTIQQSWNSYELENGITLKVRISIVQVNKTSKFDDRGIPVYFIESSVDLKTELPEHLKELSQKIKKDAESVTFKPVT